MYEMLHENEGATELRSIRSVHGNPPWPPRKLTQPDELKLKESLDDG